MPYLDMDCTPLPNLPWKVRSKASHSNISKIVNFDLPGLSETIARELSPFNISVLIVQPGLFQTNFAKSAVISKMVPGTYDSTPVGHLYRRVETNISQRNETGDPRKAAQVIFKAVAGAHPERKIGKVLRLPLGADASSMLRQKMESLRGDYENTKEIAKTTDRDL
jgi:short-subunit dehydrogenase